MTAKNGKRILYAASTAEHLERFHLDYIAALRREGFTVETLACGGGADFDVPFKKRLFSMKNLLCIARIRKIIKNGSFDAIIMNTSLAAFLIRLACPRNDRPRTICVVHGYLFSERLTLKGVLLLLCEIAVRRKTDVILTMNDEDTRLARRFRLSLGGVLKTRGMGAKLRDVITPALTIRERFFAPDAFLIVFVGELSKRKNQSLLIRAMKNAKKHLPNAVLCLVGDGGELVRLRRMTCRLGISDSVRFMGERRDACDFIRAADLYVSASKVEGMPFNIIEALEAERIVLASDIKGHRDLVEDGESGFLFRSECKKDLADKLIKLGKGEMKPKRAHKKRKHSAYKKDEVFPETLSILKRAISENSANL